MEYVDNEELRLGFEDLLEFDYPQLKATDVAVEDLPDETKVKVTFTMSRPTLKAVEAAKRLLESMSDEYSESLATE